MYLGLSLTWRFRISYHGSVKQKLTSKFTETRKPNPTKREDYGDTVIPSLVLRVNKSDRPIRGVRLQMMEVHISALFGTLTSHH